MVQQDFVIYCPVKKAYAQYVDCTEFPGWVFDELIEATGFNDLEEALRTVNGFILPSGFVVRKKDPRFDGCVVRKRTVMAQIEDV